MNYPHATSLLLLCDGGGSNAANRYIFKYGLETLAERIGLAIRVCHYPPYESKYNPIEDTGSFPMSHGPAHGVIFDTMEKALGAMAEASTTTGLTTTEIHLLEGDYQTGEKAPKNYKKTMRIVFDDELTRLELPCHSVERGKLKSYRS